MSPYPNSRKAVLTTLLCLLFSFAAQAEEGAYQKDQIIVTASRYEQPISHVGSSISVLTQLDLETNQYTYVLDALQSVPGVTTNQNGAFGGVASVSIRGMGGDRTKLLLDGVELNDSSSPGTSYNFGTLDPYGISRIEILRGPQSILFGSSAIGGVINIITPSGAEGFGGAAFAEGGSYATFRGGATVYGGTERLSFNLSAVASTTDGISAADKIDGNTEKDSTDNISVNSKITANPTEKIKAELFVRYADTKTDFDGFALVGNDYIFTDTPDASKTKELTFAGRLSADLLEGRFHNALTVSYSKIDRRNFNEGVETYFTQGERLDVDYLGVFEVSKAWTLTAGAEHETIEAKTVTPEKFSINSVFGEIGYADDQGITFTAGVRLDDHDAYGSVTSARITGSYAIPGTDTRIKGNWGEGFKAPSVFQLTYICTFCGLTEPNSELMAEDSQAWEIGLEQTLFNDALRLEITYFNQRIDNMIIFTYTQGYANVSQARSKGLEFSMEAILSETLTLLANYTYTKAIDLDTRDMLIRTPEHMVSAKVNWQATERLQFGAKLIYNGKEVDLGGAVLGDWVRVDLTTAYDINEVVTLYARVDNVLDKQYQQVPGYGTPGLSAYAGIRASF